jgi:hypothetical protein
MQVVQPPTRLSTLSLDRAVFLAGSIDLGKSVDWQAALASSLADCPGTLLNPRRDQWDSSWLAEAVFPPFREQVEWELSAMEAAGMVAFYFAPQSQAPVTLLELGLAARERKAVVCCPPGYWRKGNVDVVCERYDIPMVVTLEDLTQEIRAYSIGTSGI